MPIAPCTFPSTIVFSVSSPERGFERTGRRAETQGEYDRFELEKLDFHCRVRKVFLKLAEQEPRRVKIIDADREQAAVQADVRKLVDELIR